MSEDKKPNNMLGREEMFDVLEDIFGESVNLYRDVPYFDFEGLQKKFIENFHKYTISKTGMDERDLLGEEYQEPNLEEISRHIKRARRDPEYRGLFQNPFKPSESNDLSIENFPADKIENFENHTVDNLDENPVF